MQFTAQLDVDVVALEAEDEVTCLVSLTAPVPEEIADDIVAALKATKIKGMRVPVRRDRTK